MCFFEVQHCGPVLKLSFAFAGGSLSQGTAKASKILEVLSSNHLQRGERAEEGRGFFTPNTNSLPFDGPVIQDHSAT